MYHGFKESCEFELKGGGGWVINKPPIHNKRKSTDKCGRKNPKHEALQLHSLKVICVL
jgi:hypothetical protein